MFTELILWRFYLFIFNSEREDFIHNIMPHYFWLGLNFNLSVGVLRILRYS